jgi:hypothetical protein
LFFLMGGLMIALPVGAQSITARLDVSSEGPVSGEQIEVEVLVDLSSVSDQLGAYEARLSWDAQVLELVEVGDGTTAGFANPNRNSSPGELGVSQFSVSGAGGVVSLLMVRFNAIGQSGQTTALDLSFSVLDASQTFANLLSQLQVLATTVQVEEVAMESPVSIDFDLADGSQGQGNAYNAVAGKVYELQLNVEDAPEINGWSVLIEYDLEQVNYVSDSFQVSDFLPGLVSLPLAGEGSIGVGGAILGSDAKNSGEGSLGTLSFEILEGFAESTDLVLTEVSFRRTDGMDDIRAVRFVATISSEVVEPPCPEDFDGNNLVNFQDFFRFADHFGITEASPDWDPLYDLAPNGAINFQDFFVFADAFGTQCAE